MMFLIHLLTLKILFTYFCIYFDDVSGLSIVFVVYSYDVYNNGRSCHSLCTFSLLFSLSPVSHPLGLKGILVSLTWVRVRVYTVAHSCQA
jgi:hypothetical protein